MKHTATSYLDQLDDLCFNTPKVYPSRALKKLQDYYLAPIDDRPLYLCVALDEMLRFKEITKYEYRFLLNLIHLDIPKGEPEVLDWMHRNEHWRSKQDKADFRIEWLALKLTQLKEIGQ